MNLSPADALGFDAALSAARTGAAEGGVPIGSALVRGTELLASGYNRRVQQGDPMAHAEIDCFRAAGRRTDYGRLTLYSTLAPCALCSGAIVQFGIRRVVVGEAESFPGELQWLQSRGVEVIVLNDPHARQLMQEFIRTQPALWNEDIGVDKDSNNA